MKSYQLRGFISALFSVFLLISCGSGGGGMTAGGGIGGTGVISSGTISAFGSIVVNGTEFETSNAAIIVNGEEIGIGDEFVQENLDIGRVVTVEGTLNGSDSDAVAVRVIYRDNVEGPVEGVSVIDDTTKEIVVLGQTVIVNVITKFEETTFDTIAIDDVVEVSGYLDDTGAIRATFVGKTADITPDLEYEVTGFVANLDTDSETFKINDLTVDYSSADTNALPGNEPADGQLVEVEGTLDATGGVMIATKIELSDELGGEDGDEIEIMGFVTEIISENDIIKFKIGNQEVHVNSDPEIIVYVDGDSNDIAPGQKLEAEGSLEGGILFAWEIEFWKPDQIEVEGIVDEVVFKGVFPDVFLEFTFEEREDQLFQTNNETKYEDVEPEEIEARMALEVKGVPVDIDHSVVVADKVSFEIE
jgi:hypothetical protein